LVKALADAPSHGFQPNAFPTNDLAPKLGASDPGARSAAEQTLLNRAAAYARALHGLAIPAKQKPPEWDILPAPFDADAELHQALAQGQLQDWLAALPPTEPRYQSLRSAYDGYLKLVASGGWPELPASGGRSAADALLQR